MLGVQSEYKDLLKRPLISLGISFTEMTLNGKKYRRTSALSKKQRRRRNPPEVAFLTIYIFNNFRV